MATKIKLPSNIKIKESSLISKVPLVLVAIGILSLIYWSTLFKLNAERSMMAYLFSFCFIVSLGLGAMGFVLIQHVTRAGWSVVVRRLLEDVTGLMPLFIIFFVPIALFSHDIFPWLHKEHLDAILVKKLGYLNEPFFLGRSFGYLLLWAIMGVWLYRTSICQDIDHKKDHTVFLQAVSAPAIIIYGITLTFASIDWIMSLQPHWYSTIFGVYFFAGSFLFALAFLTLMCMLIQKAGALKNSITDEHYHDLGKLLFGFTVFWAYIAFSQFMLIWYGNIPEEIEFYTHRLHHGYEYLSWGLPILHFFIPFFALMSRALKRVKIILALNCIYIIFVHIIDLYWLIMPTYTDETGAAHFDVTASDIASFMGLSFIFLGAYFYLLQKRNVVAIGDPRLKESLAFENF